LTWYSTDGADAIKLQPELPLEPLLHDLHVQQPQEAAAIAEPSATLDSGS